MAMEKRQADGQLVTMDRISELPEFILHYVLSFLDTQEACRTCTLSKIWTGICASNPVLDFRPEYFKKESLDTHDGVASNKHCKEYYDEEMLQRYVGFVDNTMQRYSVKKHAIRKLKLEVPMADEQHVKMIDKWIEIAVQNGVKELDISILVPESPEYRLPEVLFSAKNLKVLRCSLIEVPYYRTLRLTSLQILELHGSVVDEPMLQRVISSCPLTELRIHSWYDLTNISIPWLSKSEFCNVSNSVGQGPTAETTWSLETFDYLCVSQTMWPFKMNAGALRNLRKLHITCALITDMVLENLVSQLPMLETLALSFCDRLKYINISSSQLKELELTECQGMHSVTVNAPHLVSFWYTGIPDPDVSLSVTSTQQFNAEFQVDVLPDFVRSSWFIKLKEFLRETNIFKVLEVIEPHAEQIEFDEDEMRMDHLGSPYDLKELKLPYLYDGRKLEHSSLLAFVDGLLWCCHPEVLSVTTCLTGKSKVIESLLHPLKQKAKCWRHPLKRFEVEGANCSRLVTDSMLEIRFRLYW